MITVRWLLLGVTLTALTVGGVAWAMDAPTVADACWIVGTVAAILPALWWVVSGLRAGRFGVDILAVLSLAGALAVGEYLAGALIGVMLATGQALDAAAERRATKDLRTLLDRVPRTVRRRSGDVIEVVDLDAIAVEDLVVVGPGEVLPVDGRVHSESAAIDDSALTGEPLQVRYDRGETVRSGSVNVGAVLEMRASATAADSTYAGIVRLAKQAAAESAPVVRIADRVAAWFVPLALAVAGLSWLLSGSAGRAVAVLVVATPCPLLLAAPVAIVSGLSRASRIGVLVRGGGPLETLGRATTLVLDKTGTLTTGRPRGTDVVTAPGWTVDEVLGLAASADQLSPHVLAAAIGDEARARGLSLSMPTDTEEEAGTGVAATVDGRRVRVGDLGLHGDVADWTTSVLRDAAQQISARNRDAALATLRAADVFLRDTLLPHEDAEDAALYPALAGPLGSAEATATMSRMHAEIHRLAQRLHSHREIADAEGTVTAGQSDDLLACLYGLHALLSLHFVQEEENFFVLAPPIPAADR